MLLRDEPVMEEAMSVSSASGATSPALSSIMLYDPVPRQPVPRNGRVSDGIQSSELSTVSLVQDEIDRVSKEKSKILQGSDDQRWRESIRQQMEAELDQRVRDALESPPPPRHPRQLSADSCKKLTSSHHELEHLNAHVLLDLSDKERAYLKSRRWKALQAKRQMQRYMSMNYASPQNSSRIEVMFRDELSKSNQDEFPGVFGLTSFSEGVKDLNELHRKPFEKYTTLRQLNKQYYTREGFLNAARIGRFPDGTILDKESDGSYEDRFGVIRNQFGPFWPNDWGPLYPAPKFLWDTNPPIEPLYYFFKNGYPAPRRENYRVMKDRLGTVKKYFVTVHNVIIMSDASSSKGNYYLAYHLNGVKKFRCQLCNRTVHLKRSILNHLFNLYGFSPLKPSKKLYRLDEKWNVPKSTLYRWNMKKCNKVLTLQEHQVEDCIVLSSNNATYSSDSDFNNTNDKENKLSGFETDSSVSSDDRCVSSTDSFSVISPESVRRREF